MRVFEQSTEMSFFLFKTACFVEKQIKLRYYNFRNKLVDRGFIKPIRQRHNDCKKSVEYEANY
jgi:hypothetical protein